MFVDTRIFLSAQCFHLRVAVLARAKHQTKVLVFTPVCEMEEKQRKRASTATVREVFSFNISFFRECPFILHPKGLTATLLTRSEIENPALLFLLKHTDASWLTHTTSSQSPWKKKNSQLQVHHRWLLILGNQSALTAYHHLFICSGQCG